MAYAFDTLVQTKRLREAGFEEKQAEALTAMVRDAVKPLDTSDLATKSDLAALKADLKSDLGTLKADLKADVATKSEFATLKADLKAELIAFKAEIKADLADFKTEIKAEVATKSELATLKADLKAELASKNEIAALKADLLQWIIGLIAGAVVVNAFIVVGTILGLLRLLGR
jgi:hypothetical protein